MYKSIINLLLTISFVLLFIGNAFGQVLEYKVDADNSRISAPSEVLDTCFNKALWNSITSSVINVMDYSERITEKSKIQSEIITDNVGK